MFGWSFFWCGSRRSRCGLITASQHRKRLEHDAQGGRGAGASRFRFGGKKEAAGVCRGCGESMEIQSKLACNQIFSTKRRLPMKRTLQAHTLRVWHNRASAAPAASFLPTIRAERPLRAESDLEMRFGLLTGQSVPIFRCGREWRFNADRHVFD